MSQNPDHFRSEEEIAIEEQVDGTHEVPYGEVTEEDLATDELVFDGADLMQDDSEGAGYVRAETDTEGETIEDRIVQEEGDPAVVTDRENPELDEEALELTEEVTRDVDPEAAQEL
ncbi:MAG: hypothetical protein Q4G64_02380 [bacterium]|nr:hypothetical protein [bacterium]